MSIKLQIGRIIDPRFAKQISDLQDKELPAKTAYAFSKLLKRLAEEEKTARETLDKRFRDKLKEEGAKLSEQDEKDLSEFLGEEVDFGLDPIKLPESFPISVGTLMLLDGVITVEGT